MPFCFVPKIQWRSSSDVVAGLFFFCVGSSADTGAGRVHSGWHPSKRAMLASCTRLCTVPMDAGWLAAMGRGPLALYATDCARSRGYGLLRLLPRRGPGRAGRSLSPIDPRK